MGCFTSDLNPTCNPLYTERPMGKNIWFIPRFGLTPANAQVGHAAPPVMERLESIPFWAKLAICAPFEMEQSMDAAPNPVPQPNCAFVAEIAFSALATLRKRASPVWFVSTASSECRPIERT